MFNKITASLLFALINLVSFAQNAQNTIKVVISETVDVNVSEYIYVVSNSEGGSSNPFDLDFDFDDEGYEEDEEETIVVKKSISQMVKELESAKFQCQVNASANYDVDSDQLDEEMDQYDRQEIVVRVKTIEELNRLSKFVLLMDDAHGELRNVEFEDISNYYTDLFPKMMKSAKGKATIISSTAGKKIGEVVMVSEGNGGLNLYGDEMADYMSTVMEMGNKLWKKNVPTSKSTKVSLTYVFELK